MERREHDARSPDDKESRQPTNPYKTLMGQFYGWMHQLPVIGFNSGKYDLNAIKQFLIPYFLSTSKTEEQEEDEEEKEHEDKDREEENDGIGSFFFIKRVIVKRISFDGSVEIPRHDQLHSPGVQLRQISESIRMRGEKI